MSLNIAREKKITIVCKQAETFWMQVAAGHIG